MPQASLRPASSFFSFRSLLTAFALIATVLTASQSHAQTAAVAPNWTQQSPVASPAGRFGATMAYNPAIGKVVLFGGGNETSTSDPALGDTWTYDGTTWAQQFPANTPPVRQYAAMAYDAAIGQVVLFGGQAGTNQPSRNDTWTYDGTNWTQQVTQTSPTAAFGSAMAYDAATGQIVLFGGIGATSNATWTFDGTNWTKQTPANSPQIRRYAAMAYDAVTGQVVMFGGQSVTGIYLSDTWTWNGSIWTQQTTPTSPSGRYRTATAYDPATGQVLLFGGVISGNTYIADTWAYDGTTWTQQAPAITLPQEASHQWPTTPRPDRSFSSAA